MKKDVKRIDLKLSGTGVHPGTVIAPAILFRQLDLKVVEKTSFPVTDIAEEKRRLSRSIDISLEQLHKLSKGVDTQMSQIFSAQCVILQDQSFIDALCAKLSSDGDNIEHILANEIRFLEKSFQSMENPKMRQQFLDVEDVLTRLLRNLLEIEHIRSTPLNRIKNPSILVAANLLPSDFALIDQSQIVGMCIEEANAASHVGIIASTLGIPAIINAAGITSLIKKNDLIAMDGYRGEIAIRPSKTVIQSFESIQKADDEKLLSHKSRIQTPCTTSDGQRILLMANIGSSKEAQTSLENGADGIGLLRTEFFHLSGTTARAAEEETRFIKSIYDYMGDKPVTVRLLDSGADKKIPGMNMASEQNPQLGIRGIRLLLNQPEFFKSHLSNILSAAKNKNIRILIPFVSHTDDLDRALEYIQNEISDNGINTDNVSIGIMVEIPSVVYGIRHYLDKIDFLSIGTNDLYQYTFAVSREDSGLDQWRHPLHPVMFQMIKAICDTARENHKEVSVCGELASNPSAAIVLMGIGIRMLSMKPASIKSVKETINNISLKKAEELAEQTLNCRNSLEVREILEDSLEFSA